MTRREWVREKCCVTAHFEYGINASPTSSTVDCQCRAFVKFVISLLRSDIFSPFGDESSGCVGVVFYQQCSGCKWDCIAFACFKRDWQKLHSRSVYFQALDIPEHFEAPARLLHEACVKETKVSEGDDRTGSIRQLTINEAFFSIRILDLIAASREGYIPDDPKLKCYIHCLFDHAGMVKCSTELPRNWYETSYLFFFSFDNR